MSTFSENQPDFNNHWQQVMPKIIDSLRIDSDNTWFKDVGIHSLSRDKVELVVPNTFAMMWIEDNYLRCHRISYGCSLWGRVIGEIVV